MKKTIYWACLALYSLILFSSCFGYTVHTQTFPNEGQEKYKRPYPAKNWKKIKIYDWEETRPEYTPRATIVITGTRNSSLDHLYKRMRKAAGLYNADAVIIYEQEIVERASVDGLAVTANIITSFSSSDEYCPDDDYLDTVDVYETTQLVGFAIKYKNKD